MILPRLQGCSNLTNKVNLVEIGKVCVEGHQETLQNTYPCVSVSAWCWCSWASGTHRPFTRLISRSEKGYGSLQVGVRKCATARSGDGNDGACLCKKLKTLPLYTSYVNDFPLFTYWEQQTAHSWFKYLEKVLWWMVCCSFPTDRAHNVTLQMLTYRSDIAH